MLRITFKTMYCNTTVLILMLSVFPLLQLGSCTSDPDIVNEGVIVDATSEESIFIPVLQITEFIIQSIESTTL